MGNRKNAAPSRNDFARGFYMPPWDLVPVTDLPVGSDRSDLLRGNDWLGDSVDYAWLDKRGSFRGVLTRPRQQYVRLGQGRQFWLIIETADGEVCIVRQLLAKAGR
jgi:hypothetical protein